MTGTIRIGISGWTYPPWRGPFYPAKHPQKRELEYAARQFRSIEINGTFYGSQKPDTFAKWHDETPAGFVFALKAAKYITHERRLRDIATPLANFFAQGLLRLGPKLGPLLWQFPPNMIFDEERWAQFLPLLPHSTAAAARLAERNDGRKPSWTEIDEDRPLRHAVEIRHESFRDPRFVDMLRDHNVALVCADTVAWPRLMDLTSDFVYCRLHGEEDLYASGYTDAALDDWARRVRAWARGGEPADAERVGPKARLRPQGRDVFVFFDNSVKVKSPENAKSLMDRLNIAPSIG